MFSTSKEIKVLDLPDNCAGFLHMLSQEEWGIVNIAIEKYNNRPGKYALLTFETHEMAESAIKELNYTELDGIPLRFVWADPETKRIIESGRGCLLISGLEKSIIAWSIHKELSLYYGDIIYCYIPVESSNVNSITFCDYAYVQFRNPENAEHAKEMLFGAKFNDKEITITDCVNPPI